MDPHDQTVISPAPANALSTTVRVGGQRVQLTVRLARPEDVPRIREICYATAFLGRPANEWIDANFALYTDFWLGYYLKHERENIYVAEIGGKIVGYLTGCYDSRRQHRYMHSGFILDMLKGFMCFKYRIGRKTIALLWRLARDGIRHGYPRIPWSDYPVHTHYNIADGYRGAGILFSLWRPFIRRGYEMGLRRVHGLLVLTEAELKTSYAGLIRVFDARPTTAYANADPRPLFLASVILDLQQSDPRFRRKWKMAMDTTDRQLDRSVPNAS